jgi:uncharacterized pyridoxamine 5'-phosphate oxidase family protein
MPELIRKVINFLEAQGVVLLTTIDEKGFPHSSCKGIVKIEETGRVYLLDAYRGTTFRNLKRNPRACLSAFNEHKFRGYSLKGRARPVRGDELSKGTLKLWEKKITARLTDRLLSNVRGQKGHRGHPEALLPEPKYMIVFEVESLIDLTPPNLK